MGVGSVGGGSFDPRALAAQMAQRVMKAADTNGDGKVSKTELDAFQKALAAKGGKGAQSAKGVKKGKGSKAPSVDELVAAGDEDGDEELTLDELTKAMKTTAEKARAQAASAAGGPGGAGGVLPASAPEEAGKSGSSTDWLASGKTSDSLVASLLLQLQQGQAQSYGAKNDAGASQVSALLSI